MEATPSSLSHIRAVNQLSSVLACSATWESVVEAIEAERVKPDDVWAKRCMEGIETILIDDGLDGKSEVFDYSWHDRLIQGKCKRIVRIERIAEEIIDAALKQHSATPDEIFSALLEEFEKHVKEAIADPEVVGFKSVICYRTGLNIPAPPFSLAEVKPAFVEQITKHRRDGKTQFKRLDKLLLNAFLVHKTASIIQSSPPDQRKPFQFHTGLGDNDITLTKSSPSHLQDFIRRYPLVPIVLLHASYPWTKEAGYLATVYENVYADIGEIFPFLSKDGQENAVREILELCPSEKVLWSTDGHWFPETYLLAVIQVREAFKVVSDMKVCRKYWPLIWQVLEEYVTRKVLSIPQAIKIIEDIFFNTSNKLYSLNLRLVPLEPKQNSLAFRTSPSSSSNLDIITSFLKEHSSVKFIRLQYLDYTATPKVRVIPVKRALTLLGELASLDIGITQASLALLQNDTIIPGESATGEYRLHAVLSSLKPGPSEAYASVQCEFREDGAPTATLLCPRSVLHRTVLESALHGLEFRVGFEIEIVFLVQSFEEGGKSHYATTASSAGHGWSSARALQDNVILKMVEEICETLAKASIYLEQWHPESCSGQFEFVLPSLPPLEAVDTLLHAREIIYSVAAAHGIRATLHPKPFPMQAGTAAHVHISISSPNGESVSESFYAGILSHLRAICAFTYSNEASYDRAVDGCWAGGTWVAWGTQNRETPLRKVKGSHWEIKCLDGLANPYLAIAAIISAGVEGVAAGSVLDLEDCKLDPASLTAKEREKLGIEEKLPTSLKEALEELDEDEGLADMLGKEVVIRYKKLKEAEAELLNVMDADERRGWIIDRY